MLSLFELLAVLLTITATFAWLNQRVLRLPSGIGLLVMGLSASLVLIGLDFAFPGISIHQTLLATLEQIDFYDAVMNGMLAFLLFAGALPIDLLKLRDRALVVAILATVSVAISTLIIATGIWWAASLLAIPLDFAWALVFGALIAPTDPVAVLSLLKTVTMPRSLKIDMPAEALFNDGVAVVIFGLTLGAALGNGGSGVGNVLELIAIEAGG
ncbi:MAG: cation:proton antiporter, partial [Rhizobiales bacterium]|nr:cation:proton antiporter [Hyphomicrobiales bacterium]